MIYPHVKREVRGSEEHENQCLQKLFTIGQQISRAVSKEYKNLNFDVDGIFMNMLLLKKKKYACKKLENFAEIQQNLLAKKNWVTEM
jgi:DNA polymerase alpha subunit A